MHYIFETFEVLTLNKISVFLRIFTSVNGLVTLPCRTIQKQRRTKEDILPFERWLEIPALRFFDRVMCTVRALFECPTRPGSTTQGQHRGPSSGRPAVGRPLLFRLRRPFELFRSTPLSATEIPAYSYCSSFFLRCTLPSQIRT